jgi:hypothetical protein
MSVPARAFSGTDPLKRQTFRDLLDIYPLPILKIGFRRHGNGRIFLS